MPQAQMGNRLPIDSTKLFIDLKSKNEKITIRFAAKDFYYNGKHFTLGEDQKWQVTDCPRVNENKPCGICDIYFDLAHQAKKAKDQGDKALEEKLMKEASQYKAKTTFYYPVLDRDSGLAKILKTTLSTRLRLEEYLEKGIAVLNYDFIYMRTERVGNDYYTLDRIDSAETKPLTESDNAELLKAQNFDLADIVNGKKSNLSLELADERNDEPAADDIVIPEGFGQASEGDVILDEKPTKKK